MSGKMNPVLVAVLLWLVLATALVANTLQSGGVFLSTDDAMRLAEVRDWLAGQSWFDTAQWRMNTPYGLPMHWSRLVDAGIGSLIVLFRPFAGNAKAELLTEYVWPVLLLLPALLAVARIGTRIGGKTAGLFALLLGASCSVALAPFRPGSLDHDNVQLALTLWMIALLLEFDRSRWAAAGAAVLACISLAVGLQTLPYVVVALLAAGSWWIAAGDSVASSLRWFGMSFAAASVLLLGGATASAYRFAASCDTFSGFYALLGAAGGAGLAAISLLPLRSGVQRALAFAGLGCALFGLAALTGSECLKGPYANVDPRLGPIWFSRIEEVQSPFALAPQAPGNFLAGYVYAALAALGACAAVFFVEQAHRRAALTAAAFALAGLAVTSVEVRGLGFAQMYAMPALAAFVVLTLSRLRLSGARTALATIVALIFASNASFALAAAGIEKSLPRKQQFDAVQKSWSDACLSKTALAPLTKLPRGRVLSFVDQGPYILIDTPDAVVAGPYHRDAAGIVDSYDVFTADPARSRQILARRGIDYLVVCTRAPDYAFYRAHDGGKGVLSLLAKTKTLPWLAPVSSRGAVQIYRVR